VDEESWVRTSTEGKYKNPRADRPIEEESISSKHHSVFNLPYHHSKQQPTQLVSIPKQIKSPTMRFSTVLISSLAALASAAPNDLAAKRNNELVSRNPASPMAAAIIFAAEADCSFISCAEVVAAALCIGAALVAEVPSGGSTTAAVVACVSGGLPKVCIP
jgi:hypothetical protein